MEEEKSLKKQKKESKKEKEEEKEKEEPKTERNYSKNELEQMKKENEDYFKSFEKYSRNNLKKINTKIFQNQTRKDCKICRKQTNFLENPSPSETSNKNVSMCNECNFYFCLKRVSLIF